MSAGQNSSFVRDQLPVLLCFVTGMIICVATFVPHPVVAEPFHTINDWTIIIASFAIVLGLASLIRRHLKKVRAQDAGWGYSAVMLISLVITATLGVGFGMSPKDGDPIIWIYDYLNKPLSSTMFSLTVFFIASAAYKAFRVRTVGATVLLVSGLIVMIGQIPLGGMLHWSIPALKDWLLMHPNMAAQRGIMLGLGLSMFATSLKILLGIERSYMGKSR